MSVSVSQNPELNGGQFNRITAIQKPFEKSSNSNVFDDFYPDNFIYKQNAEAIANELDEELKQIIDVQGIAGKTWNAIKNKVPILSKLGCTGSDKIQEFITKANNGEISKEEVREEIKKYKKNQTIAKEIILDTVTLGAVFIGLPLASQLAVPLAAGITKTIILEAEIGMFTRIGLGILESATNNVENDYTYENFQNDSTSGIAIGLTRGLNKALGSRIPKVAVEKLLISGKNKNSKAIDYGSYLFLIAAEGIKCRWIAKKTPSETREQIIDDLIKKWETDKLEIENSKQETNLNS